MNRYLFVGGPWDGRWVAATGEEQMVMPDILQPQTQVYDDRNSPVLNMRRYLYTLQRWNTPDEVFLFYVYNLTHRQAFRRLMECYRVDQKADDSITADRHDFRPAFIETLVDPVTWYRSTVDFLRDVVVGHLVFGLRNMTGRAPRGAVILRLSARYADPIHPESDLEVEERRKEICSELTRETRD